MSDQVLRRAARAIADLHQLAMILNDAGYYGDAIRLQGFAGWLKCMEGQLIQAQAKIDANATPIAKTA